MRKPNMKTAIHKSIRFLNILITAVAFSACTVDHSVLSEQVSLIDAKPSSTSAISLTNSSASAPATHDQKDQKALAGFTHLWSESATELDSRNIVQNAASLSAVSKREGTHEYAQIQLAMRSNDFEHARKIASTSAMKTTVEQEYQMHQEMLSTELITARADQEIGTTRER
jgi:hypothetical protein